MKTKNIYKTPIKKKDIIRIDISSPAHKGKLKHAIDFLCKEGTSIKAAFSGKVVFIKQDSKIGGPSKKYWNEGNRILISHKNGEYSEYEHFKYHGVKVKVNQKVRKGQIIGYSGNTGFSFGPHLHFSVIHFKSKKKGDFESLEIRWEK